MWPSYICKYLHGRGEMVIYEFKGLREIPRNIISFIKINAITHI